MTDRLGELRAWLDGVLGDTPYTLELASGDASFRRYLRVGLPQGTRIVMDAPPGREDSRPFVALAARLRAAGLNAPEVHAADLGQGFLLLSDLGPVHYLDRLDPSSRDPLYADALGALARLRRLGTADLPEYDERLLAFELGLFVDWYVGRHLGLTLSAAEEATWSRQCRLLVDNALAQPRVFVHRDYHSRNLMVCPGANPGILDFQGAVLGPVSYDPVSLLRDCYIAWPEEVVDAWIEVCYAELRRQGLHGGADLATLRRWTDLMGVQRHLKATGIFARLCHRDGKPGYLADIPRTLGYVHAVARRRPELAPLGELLAGLDGRRQDGAPPGAPA